MKKFIVEVIDSTIAALILLAVAFACGMLVAVFLLPIAWVFS